MKSALFIGWFIGWLVVFSRAESGRSDDSKHRARLSAQGIEPTADGIRKFFTDVSNPAPHGDWDAWIERLGNSSYAQRIDAQQYLIRQSNLPLEQLRAAAESANPEVAYRAGIILKNWVPERERLIESALWLVGDERHPGLAADILSLAALFRDRDRIIRASEQALAGTARNEDAELLARHIEGHDPLLAHLALSGFESIAGAAQVDRLLEWSGRRELSEADRLRAALIVAKRRDKRSLAPMIELLAAQDRIVATRASMALRRLTGETIALPTGDAPGVAATIRQWKTWLASSPATLELNVESLRAKGRRSALNGNTLIALGYKNRVVELGPDGEEVWSCDAQGVWSAEKIESGEILVACYQENKVKLIAPDKTVSWEFDVLGVLKARSLENGNVLVASHSGNRVLEINPDKKVVWEYAATTQCHDAIRLETGNTLVCTANDVLEVEPSGNVVWRFPAEQAYGIDALPDGNVLIAKLGGEVIEVDRGSNDIVWTFEFPSPVDVYRTEQGTTLVTGSNSVVEIDAEKIPLWTKEICNFGSARK